MLSITSRILREVSFDPAGNRFLGRVELSFQDDADDPPHLARLEVGVTLPHRSRYPQIEAALLEAAEREFRLRMAGLHPGPSNIFAAPAPTARLAA
jgi:hypothetical protein